MYCQKCGAPLPAGAAFCAQCAAAAPVANPAALPAEWAAPPAPVRTSGLAIASLVLGILWVWWIGSILAVIFGHSALNQMNRSGGRIQGRGMAVAGLVLGYIGLATIALGLIFGFFATLVPSGPVF